MVYSSSESDEEDYSGNQEWAWDAKQLEAIQMDEYTIKRNYLQLTCQTSDELTDNKSFMVNYEII